MMLPFRLFKTEFYLHTEPVLFHSLHMTVCVPYVAMSLESCMKCSPSSIGSSSRILRQPSIHCLCSPRRMQRLERSHRQRTLVGSYLMAVNQQSILEVNMWEVGFSHPFHACFKETLQFNKVLELRFYNLTYNLNNIQYVNNCRYNVCQSIYFQCH